jgi:predicted Zn-dependent protease
MPSGSPDGPPVRGAFSGQLSDGRSAARRPVMVSFGPVDLLLLDGETLHRWPYAAISPVADEGRSAPRLAYGRARLTVEDSGFAAALYAAAPRLRPHAIWRLSARALGIAALAIGLLTVLWWSLPLAASALTPLVPVAWEAWLADEALEELPGARCNGVAGQAALDRLVARLAEGTATPYQLSLQVRSSDTVNAFALPGGRMVLLNGLLSRAESPDEVAGVLAHELTHEFKRHPTAQLIARTGTGLVFHMLLGSGTGASLGTMLTTLSYSRRAEAEADAGAVALLGRAGIGTAGMAAFFDRLAREETVSLPPYLSTHPATRERRAEIPAAATEALRPAMNAKEWRAVQAMCRTKQ